MVKTWNLTVPSVYGWRTCLFLPLRMAKLSGLQDLSFEFSLLATVRSTQSFASEIQAIRRLDGSSKEAASEHSPSCISKMQTMSNLCLFS